MLPFLQTLPLLRSFLQFSQLEFYFVFFVMCYSQLKVNKWHFGLCNGLVKFTWCGSMIQEFDYLWGGHGRERMSRLQGQESGARLLVACSGWCWDSSWPLLSTQILDDKEFGGARLRLGASICEIIEQSIKRRRVVWIFSLLFLFPKVTRAWIDVIVLVC